MSWRTNGKMQGRRERTGRMPAVVAALLLCCIAAAGRQTLPDRFMSMYETEGRLTSVFSIVQDSERFIWMGTDDGLVRYNGFGHRIYRWKDGDSTSLCNNIVNALFYDKEADILYIGTDEGACIYDREADRFRRIRECGDMHIKAFCKDGSTLLIGTTTGMVRIDADGSTRVYTEKDGLPSGHIACIRKINGRICCGSYDHLYIFDGERGFTTYPLPESSGKNVLVLDIAEDKDRTGCLWLGTEQGMMMYSPISGISPAFLENIPVKYFLWDEESLWAGTDSGLYIFTPDGGISSFRHEADNSNSLPNNVIWCIAADMAGNIWLGTDHGTAMAYMPANVHFIGTRQMTGRPDGLDVGVMVSDKAGNLWLGGRNGMIRYDLDSGQGEWFRADEGKPGSRLAHNKVRDLYDDGDGLWIASDGGLDRLDYRSGSIRHFTLLEPTGKYSSTWMYSIGEDKYGNLWAGTYDGGIFVAGKKDILASSGPVMCSRHFSSSSASPISGNVVRNLAVTPSYVAAIVENNIDIIDIDTCKVTAIEIPDGKYPLSLLYTEDELWTGTDRGMYRLNHSAGKWQMIPAGNANPYAAGLVRFEDSIWSTGNEGLSVYSILSSSWTHIPMGNTPLLSGLSCGEKLYFGTVDGILEAEGPEVLDGHSFSRVAITDMFINDMPVEAGKEYDGRVIIEKNICLAEKAVLPHSRNTFTVEFSSFDFGMTHSQFFYRLKGLDDSWQLTEPGTNRAVFINVPAGNYEFEASEMGPREALQDNAARLRIRVRPVWYATAPAYIIYVLIVLGLCIWVFYYLQMKQQLKIEHIERERALKSADMKTEFLANVSHEFKSPLSIIMGVIGKMVSSESDAIRSRELSAVQKNAEKIHILLNQMMEFNENRSNTLFIPSPVSLQELAREVYDRYTLAFKDKNISCRFVAEDIRYIFMVDRIKMESVLQNLLSNALKFTPEGGSVLMSVSIGEETSDIVYADIKVEDTGCGIKEEELPMIFNRYYRAPSNQGDNAGGSGIGLNIAKKIVEMHKGKISVASTEGKGTCFTIRLSTMKADSFILRSAASGDYSLHSLSKVWQHERKPILLLVEDNGDIRDFITASLGKDYTFLTAEEGGKGLELVGTEKIDLIITDIAMPGMDGLTMSRTIKNTLETAFLPIIILTGKNDMETQLRSFEYADAFIAKPFNLNYLNNRIIQLLIKHEQYLRKMKQHQMIAPEVEETESPDDRLLREVVEAVNRHIDDPELSASMLCSETHYGSKQVYRKIKQMTGMGVVEFIRDVRLRKAAMFLKQGKLSVTEVMYKVGFTTASYFSKCFKEKFGMTPSEYISKGVE